MTTFHQDVISRAIHRLNRVCNMLTVEILVVLFGLGYYMPISFVQNLIIEKLCSAKYSVELCTQGVINKTIEEEMQQVGAQIFMAHHLLREIPSCILCLFMGSWSDTYGRKYAIIVPLIGNSLTSFLYLMNYYCSNWPAEYIIFASIPAGLTGDYGGFFLGIPGFIVDTQPMDVLTQKLSIMDGSECISAQIGPLIGGALYSQYRYPAVFGSCILLHVLASIFAFFKVKDKMHMSVNWKVVWRDFFRCDSVSQCVKVVLKKRESNRRAHIVWSLLAVILFNFAFHGVIEIIYFYTRYKIQWDVLYISYYFIVLGGCTAFGTFIVLPVLLRFIKTSDAIFGIIGNTFFAAYLFSTAFANDSIGMFCVVLNFIFAEIGYVTQRSCLSKWVPNSEIGKIMSIFAILQALGRNAGQIISTQIYVATMNVFAGAYFVAAGFLVLINVCIYGWILFDDNRQQKELKNHEEKENTVF